MALFNMGYNAVPGSRSLKALLYTFIIVVLLTSGAVLRSWNLGRIGINGSDNFQYIETAYQWRQGNIVFTDGYSISFFRPTAYLMHALAMKAFGVNDYSIKILHIVLDLLNILLLITVVYLISKQMLLSISAGSIYAFASNAIYYSRTELLHTPSTFLVLVAFLLWLLFHDKISRSLVSLLFQFLSGFTLGLAATTHEDLALLAPAFIILSGIAVFTADIKWATKYKLRKFIANSAMFSIGFWSIYLFWIGWIGFDEIANMLLTVNSKGKVIERTPLALTWLFLTKATTKLIGVVVMVIFISSPIIMLLDYRKYKKIDIKGYAPLFIIVSYCILFETTIHRGKFDPLIRLFIPMIPFIILCTAYWTFKFFNLIKINKTYSVACIIILSVVLSLMNIKPILNIINIKTKSSVVVRNAVGSLVGDKKRLLIAPYLANQHKPIFRSLVYFGDNANYLTMYSNISQSFEYVIKRDHIKYIFIGKQINPAIKNMHKKYWRSINFPAGKGRYRPVVCGAVYGMNSGSYALEREIEYLYDYLEKNHAKLIAFSERYGEVYELP